MTTPVSKYRTSVLFVILALCPRLLNAQNPDEWVGKKVATKPGTVLRDGDAIVDNEKLEISPRGIPRREIRFYRVERLIGQRVLLKDEASKIKGWTQLDGLILFEEAVEHYSRQIRVNPADAIAYQSRGDILLEMKQVDGAIADYSEAIRLDPGNETAWLNRGLAWQRQGDLDKAIADFNEGIRLDPGCAQLYYRRGYSWSRKMEHDKAIADYSEAIEINPDFYQALGNRAFHWDAKQEYDKAIIDFNEAIRLDPIAENYVGRARCWIAEKEHEKAIADLSEAIRLDDKNSAAYLLRGNEWFVRNDRVKALADYTEAIRCDPDSAHSHFNRGNVWFDKADYAKAIVDYDNSISADPKLIFPYNRRAWICATCPDKNYRDGKKALESATKACEMSGWTNANYVETLAAAYAESGDFDAAIKWESKAIELYIDNKDREAGRFRLKLYHDKKPYRDIPAN